MRYIRITLLLLGLCIGGQYLCAQDKVKPQKGDGVRSLLKRHNRLGEAYQKEFITLNKDKLGKDNSLLMGVAYTLPPLKGDNTATKGGSTSTAKQKSSTGVKKKEPLFGKKMAEYEVTSSELKGATFYVVSGHGGPDPGAIGKMDGHSLHEHEYAYDIALRLARNLMMKGANVHIVIQDPVDGIRDDKVLKGSKRGTCMGETIPLDQVARLRQRAAKINSLHKKSGKGYARVISIHIDSRSKSKQTDVYFFHSSSAASKQLANTMHKTFAAKYSRHQPGRGFTGTVSQRNLYMLNNVTPTSVFVELGNIQNPFDQRRFVIHHNRQALAKWMCEAFVKDYAQYKKK